MGCKCECTCGWKSKNQKIDRRKFWSEANLILAIKGLDHAGISLRVHEIERNASDDAMEAVRTSVGRRVRPVTVYHAALRKKLPWKELCKKAGIQNLASIKSHSDRWPAETIIKIIREFYLAGHPLNCKSVRFDKNQKQSELIFRITGERVFSDALYRRASKRFRGWKAALTAAGINPGLVRARRPLKAKSRSAHLPVQDEQQVDESGNLRSVGVIGFAPQNPEQILEARAQMKILNDQLRSLPDDDQRLAFDILDHLLSDSKVDTLDKAITKERMQISHKFPAA